MTPDANKDLIRRYIAAIDANDSSDSPTNAEVETDGIAIHRVADGKIVEYWAVTDVARVLQQVGALPAPQA